MSRVTPAEELSHIYQIGIEFCAKVSLREPEEAKRLQERFRLAAREALSTDADDAYALLVLANLCGVYDK